MTDEPKTEEHTHCWHTPNFTETLASYPPQHKEVCCHCGATQYVREEPPPIPDGHGPHYPRRGYSPFGGFTATIS